METQSIEFRNTTLITPHGLICASKNPLLLRSDVIATLRTEVGEIIRTDMTKRISSVYVNLEGCTGIATYKGSEIAELIPHPTAPHEFELVACAGSHLVGVSNGRIIPIARSNGHFKAAAFDFAGFLYVIEDISLELVGQSLSSRVVRFGSDGRAICLVDGLSTAQCLLIHPSGDVLYQQESGIMRLLCSGEEVWHTRNIEAVGTIMSMSFASNDAIIASGTSGHLHVLHSGAPGNVIAHPLLANVTGHCVSPGDDKLVLSLDHFPRLCEVAVVRENFDGQHDNDN